MFDLEGKSALVTGASGGIGGAIAAALHDRGARVILSGRRQDALERLAGSLRDRVEILAADLGNVEAVTALARSAGEGAGVDILVHNAGVTRDNVLMRMKDADWDTVLAVNLGSFFRLSRALIRGMMRRRWGRIIGISSIVGSMGNPGQTNYAASKAGMAGFARALAAEVASRGITVNVVAPGFIETPMTDALDEAQRAQLLQQVPVGRLGAPAEIAAAVVYLSSLEAAFVTGATLHVNGGMAMA